MSGRTLGIRLSPAPISSMGRMSSVVPLARAARDACPCGQASHRGEWGTQRGKMRPCVKAIS